MDVSKFVRSLADAKSNSSYLEEKSPVKRGFFLPRASLNTTQ